MFPPLCPFSSVLFRISFWFPDNFGLFYCFFCALCPFSPTQLRISLWLPDDFGLFYCFSQLYVHSLLPGSVFLSGFRMFLDIFTVFLSFMSIFSCSVQCFSLVSRSFWTFFLLFSALCPFSPAQFGISLWLHVHFGLFPCFSLFYVHMEEYGRLRTAKSCTEADKKVSDHRLFVPKTAFPTAIIRIGKM